MMSASGQSVWPFGGFEPPAALSALAVAVCAAGWVGLHLLKHRISSQRWRRLLAAGRVLVGFVTLWAAAGFAANWLVFATNWPIWPLALVGAVTVELLVALYSLETNTVSRKTGLALSGLRVAMAVLVIAMLAQPVRSLELTSKLTRSVAVLLDDSASMHVADRQMAPWRKLRLAEVFSDEAPRRPCRLELSARSLAEAGRLLAVQAEGLRLLKTLPAEAAATQLHARRETLRRQLGEVEKVVNEQAGVLGAATDGRIELDGKTSAALTDLKARLTSQVGGRLRDAMQLTGQKEAEKLRQRHGRLLEAVRRAAAELAATAPQVAEAGKKLDRIFYESLTPARRRIVDAVADRTRFELARDVLLGAREGERGGEKARSLSSLLSERYKVEYYTFADAVAEADPDRWRHRGPGAAAPAPAATSRPTRRQSTDIEAALRKIAGEYDGAELAGVIVLTDGRHNGPAPAEPIARNFGLRRTPVCSVVFGAAVPPKDAAVISIEAPGTVLVKDKMYVTVELKLDGLAGQAARVTLFKNDKPVDFKTVNVPPGLEMCRRRIQLADTPQETGPHRYRIAVERFDGEAFGDNNEYPLSVTVTKERTRLLMIEGRPRWEFRYLKNLFADRDRTVKLQYVLLEADRIDGVSPAPRVAASVSRPAGQVEATALPDDEGQWMKFDVIILGDVSPDMLAARHLKAIEKFVADGTGTLIVISGPRFMPHAYRGTPLEDMLPVTFKSSSGPAAVPAHLAGAEASFRIALTAEGRDNVIMRQELDADENEKLWNALPEIHWRYPILEAKPAATVLAYAVGPSPPDYMKPKKPNQPADRQALAKRRRFERTHALIAFHNVGLGKVMFLGFDRTWRLRYRVGDTRHHKFWGQVLRWATDNKLPAGTDLVKLGTDRARYGPHTEVQVRAKIVHGDFTPLVSKEVAVNVLSGKRLVLRKRLLYQGGAGGLYSASLGKLPAGGYTVELDAPAAEPMLAADNVQKVSTEFSVDPSTPVEQMELTPDRGLLGRLAGLSGGAVAEPAQAQDLLETLGSNEQVLRNRREYAIWQSWPLLVLLMMLVTIEWLLRKKEGLA